MLETSARLLRLLSLLQSRHSWTGRELGDRLGVTTRTVRNDVDRLRSLGYPVDATPGVAGGYRLGIGASLPPLLLDDDEAVAIVVSLRTAAGASVAGIEETSVRALAKLEQVLPSRLRHRVHALQALVPVAGPARAPAVDADVLTAVAGACRNHAQLRFEYRDHDGSTGYRVTEPHSLVHFGRRWYLVAWDLDRRDWRTFRADRIEPRGTTGPRFTPRELPGGDVGAYVARGVGTAMWRLRAQVTVHAPAPEVAERVPTSLGVTVEPVDEGTCRLGVGSDTPQWLALHLGLLGFEFEVHEPPELVEELRRLAGRCLRAVR